MNQEKYKEKVVCTIRELINCIANGEFEKIPSNVDIDKSWYSGGMTRDDAIREFKEWLEGQLNLWRDESGKDYVIDAFDEASLDCDDLEFIEYNPKSHGERLDFWFEIFARQDESGEPMLTFNVNV